MKNGLLTLAATATVLFGLTASASAQARPAGAQTTSATTTTMPSFELAAGYQLLHTGQVCSDNAVQQTCAPSRTYPFGLAIDAVKNHGAFGIVGEGGWAYKSDSEDIPDLAGGTTTLDLKVNTWHVAGGGRWTARKNPKLWPYGQVLAGVVVDHFSGDLVDTLNSDKTTHTSFMLQPGVGATYVVGDGWGIFGSVDYRRVFLKDESDSTDPLASQSNGRNDIRVFLGVRMILD
jgi:hypothetical protein